MGRLERLRVRDFLRSGQLLAQPVEPEKRFRDRVVVNTTAEGLAKFARVGRAAHQPRGFAQRYVAGHEADGAEVDAPPRTGNVDVRHARAVADHPDRRRQTGNFARSGDVCNKRRRRRFGRAAGRRTDQERTGRNGRAGCSSAAAFAF